MSSFARSLASFLSLVIIAAMTSQAQLPSTYTLSINIRSDADSFTTYEVTRISGNQRMKLRGSEIGQYSLINFNRPKDILWAGCPSGYELTRRTSTTRSHTFTGNESDPRHADAGVEFNE